MKTCTKCDLPEGEVEFYPHPSTTDGKRGECVGCNREQKRLYYAANAEALRTKGKQAYVANPERFRKNNLKKYGLTLEDYAALEKVQKSLCAICLRPDNGIRLAVDHNHTTGKVRGLLCKRCNKALGGFRDDPSLISRAAEYLRTYE